MVYWGLDREKVSRIMHPDYDENGYITDEAILRKAAKLKSRQHG